MKAANLLCIAGLLFFINGCFNDDNTTPVYEDVEGVVLSNEEPVVGAEIHIRNHFNSGGFSPQTEEQFDVDISFQTPRRSLFTARLYRYQVDSVIATFFNDTLDAGAQTIELPDSLLSNGIFAYEVFNDLSQGFSGLFIINKPDSLLVNTLPFTSTNDEGIFTLKSLSLALGDEFTSSEGRRFQITDSLQIIVINDGEILAKESVSVEPDTDNFFEITRQ